MSFSSLTTSIPGVDLEEAVGVIRRCQHLFVGLLALVDVVHGIGRQGGRVVEQPDAVRVAGRREGVRADLVLDPGLGDQRAVQSGRFLRVSDTDVHDPAVALLHHDLGNGLGAVESTLKIDA